MSLRVDVDVTNPGQFFACCGLFELASRLADVPESSTAVTARFDGHAFVVDTGCTLTELLHRLTSIPVVQVDPEDDTASPIGLPAPFDLRIDWWRDRYAGGRDLKVWAGTMQSVRIAQAMLGALRDASLHTAHIFDWGCIVYDPAEPTKKVEPFYFDARRAPNAHSRDIGFSPNDLDLTTTAFPAVEVLCLIGLQRFRPRSAGLRLFEYRSWTMPLPATVAAPVVSGAVRVRGTRTYRFENWFRTGQKKHKAFRPAVEVSEGE